jgi:hypothetical protein
MKKASLAAIVVAVVSVAVMAAEIVIDPPAFTVPDEAELQDDLRQVVDEQMPQETPRTPTEYREDFAALCTVWAKQRAKKEVNGVRVKALQEASRTNEVAVQEREISTD